MMPIVGEGWQQRKNGRREKGEEWIPLLATILLMFEVSVHLKFNLLLKKHRSSRTAHEDDESGETRDVGF
jgi:hypothetical protein